MTWRLGLLAVAWIAWQASFRSGVDFVTMNVSVHDGAKVAVGLIAEDFEVRDNGVRQTLREFAREPWPLDIMLLIDLSGSVREDQRDRINEAAQKVTKSLRSTDRGGLIVFSGRTRTAAALSSPPPYLDLSGAKNFFGIGGNQGTTLYDAVALALIPPVEPERRRLLLVLTDGVDTTSLLSIESLVDLAKHADARVDLVLARDGEAQKAAENMAKLDAAQRRPPEQLTMLERMLRVERTLEAVVDMTGGQVATHGPRGDFGAAFLRAIEEFRSGYVLRYAATGVTRTGWHDVTVAIKRSGNFQVRTRKGYQGD